MTGNCPESIADVVHRRIANALREEILAGVYDDGGNFPSLTKIMERFCISRPSAIKSVAELKKLGLVKTRKGSGTCVSRPTHTIGVVIPGTADSEFFAAILDGLVFNCQKNAVDLIAGDIFPKDHRLRAREAERLARHFVQKRVDGVIMQPIAYNAEAKRINRVLERILDDAGIPVVLVDYDIVPPPERSRHDLVAIDNFNAGEKAVAAGLKKFRPDAIVCSNDIAADKLLQTLKKLKVRVPADVRVTGFDDVQVAGAAKPALTTIRQPCFDLATAAFHVLLERIGNPGLPPRQILLDAPLVVRKSTRKKGLRSGL